MKTPGRTIQLFRALLPSWRFFDDIGEMPELQYCLDTGSGVFGPWLPALPQAKRNLTTFFLNPQGNYLFACHSLLEQAADDLAEWDEKHKTPFTESVSFKLIQNLVLYQILSARPDIGSPFQYRFKITYPAFEGAPPEDVLISPDFTYALGPSL